MIINIKEQIGNLQPCVMDGVTDDRARLQAYHDYIVNTYGVGTLQIPSGKLLIKDTFNWRSDRVKIKCDGEIIADINDVNKYAIQTVSEIIQGDSGNGGGGNTVIPPNSLPGTTPYEFYKNSRIVCDGLVLSPKTFFTCKGINFAVGDNEESCSRVSMNNCAIFGFDIGVTFGTRSYLIKFTSSAVYNCKTGIYLSPAYDCGENIKFNDCEIFHCTKAILIDNIHCTMYITGTSIDYITGCIVELVKGRLFIDSSYFESEATSFTPANRPFILRDNDGVTMNITNSNIQFAGASNPTMDYVFQNDYTTNPYSGLKLKDCFLQGCKTTTNLLCNGFIDIKGTSTFQWDRQARCSSIKNNLLNDYLVFNASLDSHPEFKVLMDDTATKLEGQNIKIESGYNTFGENQHSISFLKKGTPQKFANAGFVLPVDIFDSQVGFEVDVRGDKNDIVDVYFGFCDYHDGKITNRIDVIKETINISQDNTVKIATSGPRKNRFAKRHIFFMVDMYNTQQNTRLHLKNFRLTEI